jgi:hypothetical protein
MDNVENGIRNRQEHDEIRYADGTRALVTTRK